MKKWLFALLCILLIIPCATAEDASWNVMPVITHAYEMAEGKLYLEWEGAAPIYQIYLDGKNVADTIVTNAVINVKKGSHTIQVYPIFSTKAADTYFGLNLGDNYIDLDLAAFGIDPKTLVAGTPSESLRFDYAPSTLFDAEPEDVSASTVTRDCVLLAFTDRYYADEYLVTIKMGRDVNYVRFNVHDEAVQPLITRANSLVTLLLDNAYLQSQQCIVPEPYEKYTFTVQLRKYAQNLVDGQPISTVYQESKESKKLRYTPIAIWTQPPVITYASQTAEKQITLRWSHDNGGRDCEYVVTQFDKAFGFKRNKEIVAVTKDNAIVINGLPNGEYFYDITPRFGNETGFTSADVKIEVQNVWLPAPYFTCKYIGDNRLRITWQSAEKADYYKLHVSKSDGDSLLSNFSPEFATYAEYDIPNTQNKMEFVFTYDEKIPADGSVKLLFQLCAIRGSDGFITAFSDFSQLTYILVPAPPVAGN